jgi:predicted homoserine dehydrogenase-like protein
MIIVDRALEARQAEGRPLKVAMSGAGFMGRGIAREIVRRPGMELAAILCRNVTRARQVAEEAGCTAVVTDDPDEAIETGADVFVEVTGSLEYAARTVTAAIRKKRHVVSMNAELDGTLGPLLKRKADEAGVVYTNSDGDQPGVTMNLYRFVKGIGIQPVLCGNIKGLHDPYRNPTTQEGFARRWGQNVRMVTSFADGTKISFEQAIVANATGMRVARRGMLGPSVPAGTPVQEAARQFSTQLLLDGPGLVDYVVGAVPAPGVFVLGTTDDPVSQHYLNLYKLGEGPVYCFYTPYHLCHFEVATTIARAALFGDGAVVPAGAPMVEVVTAAKTELAAGTVIDGLGGYRVYGLAENYRDSCREGLLPIGLAEGCVLRQSVARDEILHLEDVERPEGRLIDALRAEQEMLFPELGR